MMQSQAKKIDDLENCYNALARSLIKHASFVYNSNIKFEKEDIINFTAAVLADGLEPVTDGNNATLSVEEVGNRLMRMEKAELTNEDEVEEIKSKIYSALKQRFDDDKRLDTYSRI